MKRFVTAIIIIFIAFVYSYSFACSPSASEYHSLTLVNQLPREISYELWWVNAPGMPTQIAYGHVSPEKWRLICDELIPGGKYALFGHYDDGELVLDAQVDVPTNMLSSAVNFVVVAS